jgi:hypothetical protein
VKTCVVVLSVSLLWAMPARAQERLPLGTPVGTAVAVPDAAAPLSYDDAGQRDPFVSLIVTAKAGAAAKPARPRVGLAGVALADVSVKGLVRSGEATLVVLEGPAGKSFVARTRDRLQDATIKTVDADGVVFAQQVVDAQGATRTRDVRKSLRQTTAEEAQ